jgi:serine/threonine protein kinase
MTYERWQQINRFYHAALEVREKERSRFLEEACAGDLDLRADIESLLATHDKAGGFLEKPAIEEVARQVDGETPSFIGRRLGPYQILDLLGVGGMGEVYRALDTRLDRSVAIKVLPRHLSERAELRERFEREARAIASLSHPHICALYDVGNQEGLAFLVMEYLEGETLSQRMMKGLLPLPEVLRIAMQIASAVDQAHRHGIVHRDLKPGNIMVTTDGLVKVLDFGLAKLTEVAISNDINDMRTAGHTTRDGTIIGTAAYMSPEQAEGKKVDVRSDIFSFGSLLYEMVTGRLPFQGGSQASILAAILREQPKLPRDLGAKIPSDLEKIITRCLRKEPERRFQHMDDLRVALEELQEASISNNSAARQVSSRIPRRGFLWIAGVTIIFIAAALGLRFSRSRQVPDEAPMVPVPLTSYPGNEVQPSFSPDGNQVAFVWDGERQDNPDIYVKMIGIGLDNPRRLTHDPAPDISPAWSPDGRFIAFVRNQLEGENKTKLLIIPSIGGPERLVAELTYPLTLPATSLRYWATAPFPLLAWTPDSRSLIIPDRLTPQEPLGLFLISIESGEKTRLTSPPAGSIGDGAPAISPDGGTLIFSRAVDLSVSTIYQLPFTMNAPPQGEPRRLTSLTAWCITPTWFADGEQFLFSKGTWFSGTYSLWAMRAEPGASPRMLTSLGENSCWPAISTGKHRLVFAQGHSDMNIWRLPLRNGAVTGPPEKLIYSMRDDGSARYSPDGTKIVFTTNRSGVFEVWVCESDGSNAVQITSMGAGMTGSPRWSPDGKQIVFDSNASGQWDIYVITAAGGRPRRLTNDPATHALASFSRDGQHIYFRSDRSGTSQIWRIPAGGGEAVQVTRNGGVSATESVEGQFVYYRKDQALWKMPVQGGDESEVLKSVYATNYEIGNQGIYFTEMPGAGRNGNSIKFFNFATGKITSIATIQGLPNWGLSVSPDKKFLLYTQMDQNGSDLMLVENFR